MGTQNPQSRRARNKLRTNRVRRGMTLMATAGVVAALAITAYSSQRSTTPNSITSTTRPRSSSTTAQAPQSVIERILTQNPSRALNHNQPLRVWVGGDSLAGHIGPTLGGQLADSGIVKVNVDFKVGSGLHDNGRRNWPTRIPEQMAKHDPEVAIFMIGANDASIVSRNVDAWAPEYRERVGAAMERLRGNSGRTVYWIGPPPMKSPQLARGTRALSELMADEATHHSNVVFIDAYAIFDDDDGEYTNRIDIPALEKTNVLVRIGDGVHFTNDGADWLAYQLSLLLNEQWDITTQSGGDPIRVSIESNGGSVPGYTPRTGGGSYRTTTTSSSTTTTHDNGATTTSAPIGTTTSTISATTTTNAPTTSVPPTTASPTTVPTTTVP